MTGDLLAVATLLNTAATRCRLYGRDHRLAREALAAAAAWLEEALGGGALSVAVRGTEMVIRDRVWDARSGPAWALARRLSAKGVAMIELLPGLAPDELEEICIALGDAHAALRPGPHVRLATATLAEPDPDPEIETLRIREAVGDEEGRLTEEARRMLELGRRLRESYEVRTRDFEEVALSLLSHVSRQSHLFLNLAEVKDHNLFTYLHTCNVATLSMGFGLYLGLSAREAFELGTAALLHDAGKCFVPREILDKPAALTDGEWAVIRRHPEMGARLLLTQPDVKRLAVTVAFEHHMHHDGVGGYPRAGFRPCRASQLVAITDTFDALFGKRSYHRRYDILDALGTLHADRGRIYHPELVDEFDRFLTFHFEAFDSEMAGA